MLAMKCPNGKWKWGEKGECKFESEEKCKEAGKMMESDRYKGLHYKVLGGFQESVVPTAPNDHGVSEGSVLLLAGVNKSQTRKYTPEFIKENMSRMDGGICHADHPTVTEGRERPERTILTMAAVVRNPRYETSIPLLGGGVAEGAVGDIEYLGTTSGMEMKAAFANDAVREQAGLSIFWAGPVKVRKERVAESTVDVPLELLGEGKLNVDFVTRPNAGGRVGPLKESEEDMTITDVKFEVLESERPDLVEEARKGYVRVEEKKEEASGMSESEKTEFEAMKARIRRADASDIVNTQISESGLSPEIAAEIRLDFATRECSDPTAFTTEVKGKVDRMKKLTESLVPKSGAHGVHQESTPAKREGAINVSDYLSGDPKPKEESKS